MPGRAIAALQRQRAIAEWMAKTQEEVLEEVYAYYGRSVLGEWPLSDLRGEVLKVQLHQRLMRCLAAAVSA